MSIFITNCEKKLCGLVQRPNVFMRAEKMGRKFVVLHPRLMPGRTGQLTVSDDIELVLGPDRPALGQLAGMVPLSAVSND